MYVCNCVSVYVLVSVYVFVSLFFSFFASQTIIIFFFCPQKFFPVFHFLNGMQKYCLI